MIRKKIVATVLCTALLLSGLSSLNVSAYGNDNVFYKFTIGAYHKNGRVEEGRYRETSNPNNAWKVTPTTSTEGPDATSTYWIENYNGDNLSDGWCVRMLATMYQKAYSGASQTTIYLTAQNNNYNGGEYEIRGLWDEETGVIVD